MIKAIIFDNFGVLAGTDTWREFTASLPQEIREQVSAINRAYDAAHVSREEFLGEVKRLAGDLPRMAEDLSSSETNKNTRLFDYIRELKKDYKIGLLSNVGTSWIRDKFLTSEEKNLFDDMVFSFEVGMAKPDHHIFLLACERLGVEPNEAVLVDDIERYCTVAKEQGMQAIVYEDFVSMKQQLEKLLADPNN